MKMSVCKTFSFDAAHYLPNYEGKCKNLHGHTWKLEVEVSGVAGGATGMIIDFANLKNAVSLEVISKFDHTLLNDRVKNPTCENLLDWIWKVLDSWSILEGSIKLERVRLWETPDSYAEVVAEGGRE